ncbi:porin family protein [Bradyrhizobium sp. 81013]|nr:porin family protein [Bradyrhizobium aeschynomenes]
MKVMMGAAAIALAATAAPAADLPIAVKAAAPVAFTWTGCFVGAHAGGAVSDDHTTSAQGATVNFSSAGFVGGGQAGCDYQFAPTWVIGGEGRAAWTSLDDSQAASVRFPALGVVVPSRFRLRNEALAAVTARLGYVHAERFLIYARGGAAWTREKIDDAFVNPAGRFSDPGATVDRTGWTAGAGVEWAFASHWSANVEYNYYDFGQKGMLLTGPVNNVSVNSLKDTIHATTIGVNYRF